MQKIDRLVWVEGVCLESYGVRIGVRATQPCVIEQLAPFLPPRWEAIEPPRELDALYSWVVGGERKPKVRTFDVMYDGSQRIARTLERKELFEEFERSLRWTLVLLSPRLVFIHAGVGWQGRAIVMPGPASAGKSTLVEAFVRVGAEYFSDEYAVLGRCGRVHPFTKPISVQRPAPLKKESRAVEAIGSRTAERPMKVGAIVVTRYSPGAISRFRQSSKPLGDLSSGSAGKRASEGFWSL